MNQFLYQYFKHENVGNPSGIRYSNTNTLKFATDTIRVLTSTKRLPPENLVKHALQLQSDQIIDPPLKIQME